MSEAQNAMARLRSIHQLLTEALRLADSGAPPVVGATISHALDCINQELQRLE